MSIKISDIFSGTIGSIRVRFYTEHLTLTGTEVNVIGHMTKMASMPIYGKNPLKIFFSRSKSNDLETWKKAKGT